MADMSGTSNGLPLGVVKVDGFTATGYETLSSNFEFITIEIAADIRTATQGGGSTSSQANLDKLIQIVSERGQPVIMGAVAFSSPNSTVLLAIEHPSAWGCVQGVSGSQLVDRITNDGINYWTSPSITITFSSVLT